MLALLALAALCIALARPHRNTLIASTAQPSSSCRRLGLDGATDVKPSRWPQLGAVRTFLKRCHATSIALIAFAGDPQVAAPPTTISTSSARASTASATTPAAGHRDRRRSPRQSTWSSPRTRTGRRRSRTRRSRTQRREPRLRSSSSRTAIQTRGLLQPLEGADRARRRASIYTIALGTRTASHPAARRIRRRRGRRLRRSGLARPDPRAADPDACVRSRRRLAGSSSTRARRGAESAYSHLGRWSRGWREARGDERVPRVGGDPARRRWRVLGVVAPCPEPHLRRRRPTARPVAATWKPAARRLRPPDQATDDNPAADREHDPGHDRPRQQHVHCGMLSSGRHRPGRVPKSTFGPVAAATHTSVGWRSPRPDSSTPRRCSPLSGRRTTATPTSSPSGRTPAGAAFSSRARRLDRRTRCSTSPPGRAQSQPS